MMKLQDVILKEIAKRITSYGPKSRISPFILCGASGENHLEERCVAAHTRHVATKDDFVDQLALDLYGHGRIGVSAIYGKNAIFMPRLDSSGSACRPTVRAA